jgi:hypothetical protein
MLALDLDVGILVPFLWERQKRVTVLQRRLVLWPLVK